MTELITIILTVIGVGLAVSAINIATFLHLLGRLATVEKGLATVEKGLSTVEKEVAFIHGLLVRRPDDAVMEQ